jgi:hypothetical protein
MQTESAMSAASSTVSASPANSDIAATRSQRARRSFWQVFGAPIMLGLVSTIGLIAALVGNGFYDALSWITLSIPVAVILKYLR